MKKILTYTFLLLFSLPYIAQQKEKIKGTKQLKIEKYKVEAFKEIEIEDNLEVYLIKSTKNEIEIEADDNLHEAIDHRNYGNTLRLSTNKKISTYKKIDVRVFYTDSLQVVTVKNDAKLYAFSDISLNKLAIKTHDYSQAKLNAGVPNFTLTANDKSEIELHLKSEETTIEMSKNAQIKALINTNKLKFDMYQKANANIEGQANELKLRLDNDTKYTGKNFTAKNTTLTIEGYTACDVATNGTLAIAASGKSKLTIYGDPKIEIIKFEDEAILQKKKK